jgi:7-carboxy-7-deazaguanine synthase
LTGGRAGAGDAREAPGRPVTGPALRVTEIYRSIQGESSFAGRISVFVRLTGCALRCVWCDSTYTFTGGRWMGLDQVLDEVGRLGGDLVEFTGGEPLLQKVVHRAIAALCDGGKTVLVETGGDQDISPLDPRAVAIVDVKCPGSGMSPRMDWANLDRLREHDELKFVLAGRGDYEWARALVRERDLARRRAVHFSCVFGMLDPAILAGWILEDDLRVRLQLQIHKILWDPSERGR